MAQIKIDLNDAGIREVLQSAEVQADLRRRAKAIAQAAGGEPDFVGDAEIVGDRVMGFVVTATHEGRRAEAEDRALTRALDAGR
jgi:hypothetical protein